MSDFLSQAIDILIAFEHWQPSQVILYTTGAFSLIAAVWLSSVLPGGRLLAMPVSFAFLFAAGLFTNFMGIGTHVEEANDVQKSVVLALAGEVVMAIIILLIFRPEKDRTN
jgi:hypothetical protein